MSLSDSLSSAEVASCSGKILAHGFAACKGMARRWRFGPGRVLYL